MWNLWDNLFKPIFKGVAKVFVSVVKWSYTNPVASIAIGIGLFILAPAFEDIPWMASTMQWLGGTMLTAGVVGGIGSALGEAAVVAKDVGQELLLGPVKTGHALGDLGRMSSWDVWTTW